MKGYKVYGKLVNKEDYFRTWEKTELAKLSNELKEDIYLKYKMKCEVLNRDNFTCQNINGKKDKCMFCQNEPYYIKLTVHHYKAKRNGGSNKVRNGVTLCQGIHNSLNRGKHKVVYSQNPSLPAHIRGSTQSIDDNPSINWKEVKAKMKIRRREVRDWFGIELTDKQWEAIFRWLMKNFGEDV